MKAKIFTKSGFFVAILSMGVLGSTFQFANAWTEPTVAPPNGNVGAPINTSAVGQLKAGILAAFSFGSATSITAGNPAPSFTFLTGDVAGERLCIGMDCRGAWPSGGDQLGSASGGSENKIAKWKAGGTSIGDSSIFDNGNVGIGSTNPSYKLDVVGDVIARSGGWLRTEGATGIYNETFGGGWYMEDSAWMRTYNSKSVWAGNGLLATNGGLSIGYGGAGSPGSGAIIAGSVGIGTTSPIRKLDVEGDLRTGTLYDWNDPAFYVDPNGTSNLNGASLSSATISGKNICLQDGTNCKAFVGDGVGWLGSGSGTTNYVTKWTGGTSIGNSSIFDNGNVGIGSSNPLSKLSVGSNGAANYGIHSTGVSGGVYGTAAIWGVVGNANSVGVYGVSSSTNSVADSQNAGVVGLNNKTSGGGNGGYFSSISGNALTTGSGNVGIGTSSPIRKLDVEGDLRTGTLYDWNDPAFYVDPNGTSNLNGASLSSATISGKNICLQDGTNCQAVVGDQLGSGNTGTVNTVAKWTGTGSTIGNSSIFDDGTGSVGIGGAVSPTGKLYVNGNINIPQNYAYKYGGYKIAWGNPASSNYFFGGSGNSSMTGGDNNSIGANALAANFLGARNVAIGSQSLSTNSNGNDNVALGYYSLNVNISGAGNIALGYYALGSNIGGSLNVANGYMSLFKNTGDRNVAIGGTALRENTSGTGNVAVGDKAGQSLSTGNQNTFIGYEADAARANMTNVTAIGAGAKATADNYFVLGNASNKVIIPGSLDVTGNIGIKQNGCHNVGTGRPSGMATLDCPVGEYAAGINITYGGTVFLGIGVKCCTP